MSVPKIKYYVVWEGRAPGVYDSWEDCEEQVSGFPGARYKSFPSMESAIEAFRGRPEDHIGLLREIASRGCLGAPDYTVFPEVRMDAVAVDGACSKNPGPMEYRCVRVCDGAEVFHRGPYEDGTNNIGEYLALIHAAALLARRGDSTTPIYTDSRTALAWLRRGGSNTKIERTGRNDSLLDMLRRADAWLATHRIANPILKWDTEHWGEIPADFGRK